MSDVTTEYDKLFIGGKWTEPSTSEVIEVTLPGHRRIRRQGATGGGGRRGRRGRGGPRGIRQRPLAYDAPEGARDVSPTRSS